MSRAGSAANRVVDTAGNSSGNVQVCKRALAVVPQTSPKQVATSGKPRSRICGLGLSSRASLAPSYDSPSHTSTFAATLQRRDDAGHTNSWQNRRHLSPAVICMHDYQPVPMCPLPSTGVALPQRQAIGPRACLQGMRSKRDKWRNTVKSKSTYI